MWIKVSDIEPPKDRIILITSGIAWRKEEVYHKPIVNRYKQVIQKEYVSYSLKEIGKVLLVYYKTVSIDDKFDKHFYPGYWCDFGGGYSIQHFNFWMEFENPITESLENSIHDVVIPDINKMPIYIPSEDEKNIRAKYKMLGLG